MLELLRTLWTISGKIGAHLSRDADPEMTQHRCWFLASQETLTCLYRSTTTMSFRGAILIDVLLALVITVLPPYKKNWIYDHTLVFAWDIQKTWTQYHCIPTCCDFRSLNVASTTASFIPRFTCEVILSFTCHFSGHIGDFDRNLSFLHDAPTSSIPWAMAVQTDEIVGCLHCLAWGIPLVLSVFAWKVWRDCSDRFVPVRSI